MKTETIVSGDMVLAIIIRNADWQDGVNFISSEDDYQQVGIWGYDKGQSLNPHIHLRHPREVLRTQEVVHIKDGRIRANIYTEEEKFLKSVDLGRGDTIVLLHGGHGYEILEDNTRVLEIKNGPYLGADKDRRRIAPNVEPET